MKKIYSSILFCFTVLIFHAQTINFNTQTLGTGYSGNNGAAGISFVIANTNPYPIYLNQINNFQSSATTLTNVTLYHSTTSLAGAPGNITTNPAWILDLTVPTVTIASAGAQNPILTNLNIAIPANDTFRFHLGATETMQYTNASAAVTPNNFTNLGVRLLVGNFQIGGANVGYGGPAISPVNNPRSFTGTVVIDATPATICNGAPIAGSTSANDTNVCSGQTVNFSLSGLVGASGQSFQWQENGINLPNDTNSFLVKTITATNTYQCIVTCNNASQSTASTPLTIVLNPFSLCYCSVTGTATSGADIGKVTVGAFTNGTALPVVGNTTANNAYTDFTNLGPVPIFSGSVISFSIASITSTIAPTATIVTTTRVYIDYNQNGIFDPVNELLFTGTGNFVGNNIITANPIIPSTALTGVTGMRVQVYQSNLFGPCGPTSAATGGETEDYLVNIQPAPLCGGTPNAGNVSSSDSTVCPSTVFNLTFQNGSIGGGVKYQWQANGVNLLNDTLLTLSTSITANTTYTCVTTCTATGQSNTSNPLLVSVNPFYNCYCSINSTSTSGADIGNVTIGSFSNGNASPISGNANAVKNYTNFTNLPPIHLAAGLPTSIKVSSITSLNNSFNIIIYAKIFIDYNQDGVYNPITELAGSGLGNYNTPTESIIFINPLIPASALTGITGMRIMLYEGTNITNPCAPPVISASGETEDYLVNIVTPQPCNGVPAAVNLSSNALNVCGNNFTLSLDTIVAALGISYNWTVNGGTIANTFPAYTTSQSATSTYQVTVTCANGGTIASNVRTVTQNPPDSCYCITGVGGFCNFNTISGFRISKKTGISFSATTLDNQNNGCGGTNGTSYSAFPVSSGQYAVLAPTDTFKIDVTVTNGVPAQVKVWADWNKDGVWNNSNELTSICLGNCIQGTNSAQFLVNSAASIGDTIRLRVRINNNSIANACSSILFGETEDYVLIIGSNTILSLNQLYNKNETKVIIFPNPTTGILNYEIPKSTKSAIITVSDLLGRTILNTNANSANQSLNLVGFKNGTYLVTINVDGKAYQSKVVLNQ